MRETEFFKVLHGGGKPHLGTGKWTVGKKRSVRGPLKLCRNGLHLCDHDHLLYFLEYGLCIHPVLECSEERVSDGKKVAVRWAVIGSAFPNWNERTARLFAADCAERALRRERKAGREPDGRSWAAVKAVRAFADGEIGRDELEASWAAASGAARAAASAAAWAAASAAARAAASGAARAAAWAAASAAARAAERKWQTRRLFDYMEGRRG